MINVENARAYCSGDISKIENYAEAVASPERWVCHHRRGLDEDLSKEELKEKGLYKKRPASELIFMTESEHKSMHMSGKNHPFYGRRGEDHPAYGVKFSDERRAKISAAAKLRTGEKNSFYGHHHTEAFKTKIRGNKNALGYHHTEAEKEKIRQGVSGEKNPMYGMSGEKSPTYGYHWFNNGTDNVFAKECPDGFHPGLMKRNK